MSKSRDYLWYPSAVVIAVATFAALISAGAPLLVSTYVPLVVTGVSVLLLERLFPERSDWRPAGEDLRADAAFMVFVQVLLPRALAFALVLELAGASHESHTLSLWPQSWPLAVQVLLMILLVDLVRYWLHRACHSVPALWRLHEVHHSPDILYVLNVGRFHPLEKVLHFALDTVPFVLLGVRPEVIAGYFLMYSVNGFFQHSNLRLRYGWLNYVVGSAETHRWHHARNPKLAYCNFGNTTIVWDLLFGTWKLPSDRKVGDIGVMNRDYPRGFLPQLKAPFRRRHGR